MRSIILILLVATAFFFFAEAQNSVAAGILQKCAEDYADEQCDEDDDDEDCSRNCIIKAFFDRCVFNGNTDCDTIRTESCTNLDNQSRLCFNKKKWSQPY